MRLNRLVLLILLNMPCFFSQAQIDAIKITTAIKAFESEDYRIALSSLNQVSDKYRTNRVFIYYLSNTYYQLEAYDSAKVYFEKYLSVDKVNEGAISEIIDKLAYINYLEKKIEKDNEDTQEQIRLTERLKKTVEEAERKKEEDHFARCRNTNDIACFKDYLRNYPTGLYAQESNNAITAIEEQKYNEARQWGSITAYKNFLSNYPNTRFEYDARRNLNLLEQKKLQRDALVVDSFRYLTLYNENQSKILGLKTGRKIGAVFGFVFGGMAAFWYADPLELFDEQIFRTMAAAPIGFGSTLFFGSVLTKSIKIHKQKKRAKVNYKNYQDLKAKSESISVY